MYTEQQLKTNLVEDRYFILLKDSLRGERNRLYGHLYSDLLNAMKYYQSVKEDVLKDLKRKAKGKEASHNKASSLYAEYETRLKTGWIRVVKDISEDLNYISYSFEEAYSDFVKRNKLKQIIYPA